jgi:periplasmic protein TonB
VSSFSYPYSTHTRPHLQGWIYSVVFHAMMGACAVALMSGFTLSFEPDSYKWNVALVEPSGPVASVDPLPPTKPEPPPKPQSLKSRVVPPAIVSKPVQQEVVPRQITQAVQDVTEVTPVNQTASTVIAQAVQPHEVIQATTPVMTQDRVVEEEPAPTHDAISNEVATPAVEPATPAQIQQPSAEQMVASAAPFKTAPTTKADYGWLMRALLGRIDELKNYPVMARMNRWEGKVILRAVIRDDGQVLMVDVQESSGRSILDHDAMETLKKASPLKLDQPLGRPQIAILMPISYSLR